MDLASLIVQVVKSADAPLTTDEIARILDTDHGQRVPPEEVADCVAELVRNGALAEAHEPGSALEGTLGDSEKWDLAILNSFLAGKDKCSRSNAIETLLDSGHIELSYAYRAQRGHLRECPTCRANHPELERQFLAYDAALLQKLTVLLQEFDLRPPDSAIEHAAAEAVRHEHMYADVEALGADDLADLEESSGFLEHFTFVVSWRSLLLGASIGRELMVYERSHENGRAVWVGARRGAGEPQVVDFVRGLPHDGFWKIFFVRRCADIVDQSNLTDEISGEPLRDLFGCLTRIGSDYPWEEFEREFDKLLDLGDRVGWIKVDELVTMLEAVAVAEADDAGAPSPPRSAFSEVLERLDDVKDRVDSGSALQLPIIDNLESIIRLLSPSSRQEAVEQLRQALGGVYWLLCPAAQDSLVMAERLASLKDPEDPSHIIIAVAKAFELQLTDGVLKPLCEFLTGKKVFAEPLIRRGRLKERLMLGEIATLLGRFPEVKEFAAVRYLDLDSLTRTIWEVSEKAGMAKHTGGFSAPAAINLKKTWLGGGVFGRGIFAQLVPPVCSP